MLHNKKSDSNEKPLLAVTREAYVQQWRLSAEKKKKRTQSLKFSCLAKME